MNPRDPGNRIQTAISQQRRKLGARSPADFSEIYLSSHCTVPFSRMHKELFNALVDLVESRDGRLAVAAPRGHAKSTIVSLAFILWCVLYQKEKFIVLVSATKDQAISLLKDVKDELTKNIFLLTDFPEACRPEGAASQVKPWQNARVQLPNGAMIVTYGAGQGLRGTKHGSDRPGLIIVDDIESPEGVLAEEQRDKLDAWFTKTLIHAGRPGTNVIVVGTILHYDSLLSNLTKPDGRPGWTRYVYQAIETWGDRPDLWETWSAIYRGREDHDGRTGQEAAQEFFEVNKSDMLSGTRVLWPEREDYYALMVTREREGKRSFQSEKQNEPIDPSECIFSEESLRYWDDEHDDINSLLRAVGKDGRFLGACDPSLGRRTGRGDYTAIVILYQSRRNQNCYVIAADIARRKPDQAIQRILEYAQMYKFDRFAVEANNFQEVMVNDLRQRAASAKVTLPVMSVENRGNKEGRIAAMEPEIFQGKVVFSRRHQLLLDQLRQFPHGRHDDGPDALEMVVDLVRKTPYWGDNGGVVIVYGPR